MFFIFGFMWFPDVEQADEDGLVALGGDLSPQRLLLAYHKGIFPWFMQQNMIYWFSPNPRMVLLPDEVIVSASMKQTIRNKSWNITTNKCFTEVMLQCAVMPRKGQSGTWINEDFIKAYTHFHKVGYAQSLEVWDGNTLIGGLYGVSIGKMFVGESMFAKVSNASKFAFIHLAAILHQNQYHFLDCQVYTSHLESLGAQPIERKKYIQMLNIALQHKTDNSFWNEI